MPQIIIEICPHEGRASACLMDGESVNTDQDVRGALADCCKSGDAQEACEFVLDQIGVEFRIVALDTNGKYENRLATHYEKARACRAIYYDSDRDFDADERWCDIYLVWQAAHDAEQEEM